MTTTSTCYGQFGVALLTGAVNLSSATVKVALCTNLYVPNRDTHQFFSDVTHELTTGGGYTAGGQALTSVTLDYDATTHSITLNCDSPTWSSSTITAAFEAVYVSTGTPSTSRLIGWIDNGGNVPSAGGAFTVDTTSGLLTAQL